MTSVLLSSNRWQPFSYMIYRTPVRKIYTTANTLPLHSDSQIFLSSPTTWPNTGYPYPFLSFFGAFADSNISPYSSSTFSSSNTGRFSFSVTSYSFPLHFFTSIFARWFSPRLLQLVWLIMLHPFFNHTPDVVFHDSHISVLQSIRILRQFQSLWLIG